MEYTILPGLTGNIIIHKHKMYFDISQKIWNADKIGRFTLSFMQSEWIDYESNISFSYGGVRFLEDGSYDMQNATNEQKFLYLIEKNAAGYDDNFILKEGLFWAADNRIYRVGLYNTQEPRPYIDSSLKRSWRPENVIQRSIFEKHNQLIRMRDRPIIEELSGFFFWDFWVECKIAIILDGKELFSNNKTNKLIYLNRQLYSTRGRYVMTPRDSEKRFFPTTQWFYKQKFCGLKISRIVTMGVNYYHAKITQMAIQLFAQ